MTSSNSDGAIILLTGLTKQLGKTLAASHNSIEEEDGRGQSPAPTLTERIRRRAGAGPRPYIDRTYPKTGGGRAPPLH